MKTLSKSKGVRENICTDATHIIPPHEDWKDGFYRHTCFGCGKISRFQVKKAVKNISTITCRVCKYKLEIETPLYISTDMTTTCTQCLLKERKDNLESK